MIIEIDIILGNTKNGMKHLGKNTNDEDDDDEKGKKSKKKGEEKKDDSPKKAPTKIAFDLNHDNLDLTTVESNKKKIDLLEETMNNFFKIFTSNGADEVNETI
jgi:hypothetical protein